MSTTAPTPSGPQPAASSRVRVTVRVPVDEVHLYVDPRHETDKVSAALARVLAKYHGGTPVILHLISSRQEIRMVPKFYVDFSEEAEEALKGLLGNAAVEGRKN